MACLVVSTDTGPKHPHRNSYVGIVNVDLRHPMIYGSGWTHWDTRFPLDTTRWLEHKRRLMNAEDDAVVKVAEFKMRMFEQGYMSREAVMAGFA